MVLFVCLEWLRTTTTLPVDFLTRVAISDSLCCWDVAVAGYSGRQLLSWIVWTVWCLSYVSHWARCLFPFIISLLVGCLVAHVFPAIGRETMELLLQKWTGIGRDCDVTTVVGILCKILNHEHVVVFERWYNAGQFAHNLHTICTQFAHNFHTVCAQFAHNLQTISTQFVHNLQTISTQFAHTLHAICTHLHTIRTQFTHRLHTVCTQFAHSFHTDCTQFTHNLHTVCTQFVHNLHTVCTHFAHNFLTLGEGTLLVKLNNLVVSSKCRHAVAYYRDKPGIKKTSV